MVVVTTSGEEITYRQDLNNKVSSGAEEVVKTDLVGFNSNTDQV